MYPLNSEKYKNAILYLGKSLGGKIEGKKRFYKLLYYFDFDYFEKFEDFLIGETYIKLDMGPVPSKADIITAEMKGEGYLDITEEENTPGYYPTTIYKIKKEPDMSVFNDQEKEMLKLVIEKYGRLNGKQLENLTHNEAPFIAAPDGGIIQYETAFYRGTFDAVESA